MPNAMALGAGKTSHWCRPEHHAQRLADDLCGLPQVALLGRRRGFVHARCAGLEAIARRLHAELAAARRGERTIALELLEYAQHVRASGLARARPPRRRRPLAASARRRAPAVQPRGRFWRWSGRMTREATGPRHRCGDASRRMLHPELTRSSSGVLSRERSR